LAHPDAVTEPRPVEGDTRHDREELLFPLNSQLAEPADALLHHVPLEAVAARPARERDADRHGHRRERRHARGKAAAGPVPNDGSPAAVVDVIAQRERTGRPRARAVVRYDGRELERRADGRLLGCGRRAVARVKPARASAALTEGLRAEGLEPGDSVAR